MTTMNLKHKPATALPCNLETLRNPEMVKRWFDQIGFDAANEIERLRGERAQLVAALRKCEATFQDSPRVMLHAELQALLRSLGEDA